MENLVRSGHVTPIDYGRQDAPERWGPGARNCHVLHYIYAGKGFLEMSGRTYPVEAEQSFLIYPNVPVLYYPDPEDPWSYVWVDFTGDEADMILRQTAFTPQHPVSSAFPKQDILTLFKAVHGSFGLDICRQYRTCGYFYVLLSYYLQHFPLERNMVQSPPYLQKAIHYITANIHRKISVQDISEYLYISRAQLYRIFKAQLSISPSDYITQYRIKRACGLLTGSALSIKVIAYSLGFESPLYFTKVFHQITGVPPSLYRKDPELASRSSSIMPSEKEIGC